MVVEVIKTKEGRENYQRPEGPEEARGSLDVEKGQEGKPKKVCIKHGLHLYQYHFITGNWVWNVWKFSIIPSKFFYKSKIVLK